MYCAKCGKKIIDDTAKYCPKCGNTISNNAIRLNKLEKNKNENINVNDEFENTNCNVEESSQEVKYLFFKSIKGEKRNIFNRRLKYGNKIAEIIIAIVTVGFIYEQIQLAENYKLIIYVIRYIIFILPYSFCIAIYEEIYKLSSIEENEKNRLLVIKTYVVKIIYLLLLFTIMNRLTEPTTDTIGLLNVIIEDYFIFSFLKYLFFIKFEILCLIILGLCNYFFDKKILAYKETELPSFFD